MGSAVSCTGGGSLDQGFEALPMRSLSFDRDNVKSTLRSVSFNGRDAEPAILKAFSSGKLIIEGSLSFKEDGEYFGSMESKISIKSPTKAEKESFMKLETKILIESLTAEKESSIKGATLRTSRFNPLNERATVPLNERATVEPSEATIEPSCKKFKAAVKLQKVYKSFKTRRQLVDCAVLVEQRWYARWKLLDFVLLKKSSVSFFDIEEPESVFSRWSRARRRIAKVGKGLSKDEKAQKLALQHWLETGSQK